MQRKIPVGIQSFEEIRRGNYVYVDKTDIVWRLANEVKNNFISRPRRFGKSLLTSTLQCYFEGKRELFEGLKIMELEKEWKKSPVLHFDFSGKDSAQSLSDYLMGQLDEYERMYGSSSYQNLNDRFRKVIENAAAQSEAQTVVLVDEYDAPLQKTIFDKEEHDKVRDVYRNFFPALKTADGSLRYLFLTGITKFTQLSLFSTLNNVMNLSTNPKYDTLCGITEEEMRQTFAPELSEMSKLMGKGEGELLAMLKEQYDGYHFSRRLVDVYNPYSLLSAFYNQDISNYWVSSGASNMLVDLLRHSYREGMDLEKCMLGKDKLENSDLDVNDVPQFLYQSGYLTIKGYESEVYLLGVPNREVKTALYDIVIPNAVEKSQNMVESAIADMKVSLGRLQIEEVMGKVQQIVSSTPYLQNNTESGYEAYFRFVMEQVFFLAGCRVEVEKEVLNGRIDMVAYAKKCVLVFELKMENNGGIEAAERQMLERGYLSAFSAEEKPVYALAVSFSSEEGKRGMTGWKMVENK